MREKLTHYLILVSVFGISDWTALDREHYEKVQANEKQGNNLKNQLFPCFIAAILNFHSAVLFYTV